MIKYFIREVNITDVAKKKKPSKHYIYIINLLWSDGTQQVICRRYCQFFDLQTNLIDAFPLESGEINPNQRILPFLPGKILFGRSNVKNVALKRKDLLTEYLQKLIALPEKISQCSLVMDFFEVTSDDIQNLTSKDMTIKKERTAHSISNPSPLEKYIAIENFEKTERNQVTLAIGDVVDLIEKCDNGWWFVSIEDEQGWAPGSFLEPLGGTKDVMEESIYGMEEKFICIKPYKAEQPDELSLTLGDVVFVLGKCSDGWWNVRLKRDAEKDYDGFVPAIYLNKVPEGAEAGVVRQSRAGLPSRGIVPPPRRNSYKMKINVSTDKTLVDEKSKTSCLTNVNQVEVSESLYVASTNIKAFGEKKIDIFEGAPVVVQDKLPNGWWYIEVGGVEGWVHSKMITRTSLKKIKKDQATKEYYRTSASFNSTDKACLSFLENQVVEVIEKNDSGWWLIKTKSQEGWAPSSYLNKMHSNCNEVKDTSKVISIKPDLETGKFFKGNLETGKPFKGDLENNKPFKEDLKPQKNNHIIVPRPLPRPNLNSKSSSKTSTDNIDGASRFCNKQNNNNLVLAGKPAVPKRPLTKVSETGPISCSNTSIYTELVVFTAPTCPSDPNYKELQIQPIPTKNPIKTAEEDYIDIDKYQSKYEGIRNPPVSKYTKLNVASAPPRPTGQIFKEPKLKPDFCSPLIKSNEEIYTAIENYEDTDESIINLKIGQRVRVLKKDNGGWWYAEVDNALGWVPSNFLKLCN
ncbi:SH3 and PX domain-containing protein 2A isoform X2 [Hydra vulgaris]|uniref:SH3 and PX domain-containing protein 2A isoform X2 n=1 Tax=Hydra vulgaris TaxID=6087 RepID=UPI00064150C8|nr:SH3 and PX domain-containing protein 2A isoform X2 [Hydra vulgaris]